MCHFERICVIFNIYVTYLSDPFFPFFTVIQEKLLQINTVRVCGFCVCVVLWGEWCVTYMSSSSSVVLDALTTCWNMLPDE